MFKACSFLVYIVQHKFYSSFHSLTLTGDFYNCITLHLCNIPRPERIIAHTSIYFAIALHMLNNFNNLFLVSMHHYYRSLEHCFVRRIGFITFIGLTIVITLCNTDLKLLILAVTRSFVGCNLQLKIAYTLLTH